MATFENFQLKIKDLFRFADGRLVFSGIVEEAPGYIGRGPIELLRDGERKSVPFLIEGEMLSGLAGPSVENQLRSVSTTDARCLDREMISKGDWVMKPVVTQPLSVMQRGITVHRHLIGLKDPRKEYVADPMTQGPVLPEDWDGDAWVAPKGNGYFLRAWNTQTGRVAYGEGATYAEAKSSLMSEVADGGTRAQITTASQSHA